MRPDQLQQVFEACLEKVREVRSQMPLACASWGRVGRRRAFGRPHEEYAADFVLVARRTLAPEETGLLLQMIQGVDATGPAVEVIQQKMGLALISTKPYPLYPIREYFQ